MAWLLPRWITPLVVACAPACSDDGEPQSADTQTETGDGSDDAASSATADATITTTLSTSITNGDDGDEQSDETDGGLSADGTGATDPTADDGFDDTGDATGTSADGTDGPSSTEGPSDSDGAGGTDESSSGDASTGGAGEPVGGECMDDADCETGVCWDFNDYDDLCSGTVCSLECESDMDCVMAASEADALYAKDAVCGRDGRCDLVGTGLGAFVCA